MLEQIRLNVTLKIGLGRRVTILDGTGSRREGDGQASSMTKIRRYIARGKGARNARL